MTQELLIVNKKVFIQEIINLNEQVKDEPKLYAKVLTDGLKVEMRA